MKKTDTIILYLYTAGGNLVKQITKGNFEVKDFLGWDQANNTFYFTSNEGSPLRTAVYKIDAKGKKTKLSTQEGSNSAIFSKNMKYFVKHILQCQYTSCHHSERQQRKSADHFG